MSTFDTTELKTLSVGLGRASGAIVTEARAVIAKGALNIKNETREAISDHPTWKRLASTVNYDMGGNAFFSAATIGYDDVGQGELAGIAEFGSVRHDPHPALMPAFAHEAPRFEKAMGNLAAKVIEDAL